MKSTGSFSKFRKCLFLLVLILPLVAVNIIVSPVLAAPAITVSPASGAPGTVVTITGLNFDSFKGDSVKITFNDIEIPGSPFIIPDTGTFATHYTVPDDIEPGIYAVVATITIGTDVSSFNAYYKIANPEIELDLPDGTVGTQVTVSGIGFYSGRTVTIYYHNVIKEKSGTVTTSSTGTFTFQFNIPAGTAGIHMISAENTEGNYAETEFEVMPSIALNLSSGSPGSLLAISGSGFAARSQVSIQFGIIIVASVKTDEFGNFSVNFNIPEVNSAAYVIKAQDAVGNLDKVEFTTTAGAFLNVSTGPVGTRLSVRGTGFVVGETVTIDYDTIRVGTTTADNNGAFSITFTVPASSGGNHVVTVSDGTTTRKLAFKVESEAPPTPEPLLPTSGSKTTAATYLDWQDVDDPSQPVTYHLQLATDENFSSITLEKTQLPVSEYTLNQNEWLRASSTPVAYYWRVRAIDAAGNASDWSAPFSFLISSPPVPALFQSEPDTTYEKTVYLNWQDVSSLSPPVNYTVQIASDLGFKNIVLEKQGLDDSEYYISNADELDLLVKNRTYYWRVKATDSVNNESEWATPTSFSLTSTFTWPSWATYLLIGIAVIIIIYLAFRFGKHAALEPPD
jgi:hypothetical protein